MYTFLIYRYIKILTIVINIFDYYSIYCTLFNTIVENVCKKQWLYVSCGRTVI
jgi:hypothetical protein